MFINFIFLIFLFPGTQAKDILAIKVKTFDQAGRPSSFIYDGGSIIISCTYNGSITANKLNVTLLYRARNQLKSGNASYVEYTLKVNSTLPSKGYSCSKGELDSETVFMKYVLCNHMSIKPKKVCQGPKDYCQIVTTGEPECQGLRERSCLYGLSMTDITGKQKKPGLDIFPKFNISCFTYSSDGKGSEKYGYCYASLNQSTKYPRFLATSFGYCSTGFNLSICDQQCNNGPKQLKMAGWNFIDSTSQLSVLIHLTSWGSTYNVTCSAVDSRYKLVSSYVVLTKSTKMNDFGRKLSKFSTPTIADINCILKVTGVDAIQYHTTLLLFNSHKDLKHSVEEIKAKWKDAVTGIRGQASTKQGLFVCVKRGKKPCTPNENKTSDNTTVDLDSTSFGGSHTEFFYIGLFASSPKKKHVLLHHVIANHTVIGTGTGTIEPAPEISNGTGTIAPVIPGLNGTGTISAETSFSHGPDRSTEVPGTSKESCGVKGSTAIIAVLAVFAVIAVVVIIVLAVLLVKRKKDESRANENEVSATSE